MDTKKFCLVPGTILGGHYQIIKPIGQGGMGMVYRGYDNRLDLQVAIKVISPDFSQSLEASEAESALKRFEAEAKIAAKIDHPNVIRIFGFNRETIEHEGDRYDIDYLIMELMSGRTLRNTMDPSGFETENEIKAWITRYLLPVLDGLQKVHESGIIHRDIKPENFFLKNDVPKLADFGLSLGLDMPSVTGTVADIFGTMPYMAPEQFYNFSLVQETADVYSVGKILFELVEGKMTGQVKPLKQVRLSNPDTDFLAALNRIVMDATHEDPGRRIQSVAEFKIRLSQLLYCPNSSIAEAPGFLKTPPPGLLIKIIMPLAVALVLIAGVVLMHWLFDIRSVSPPERSTLAAEDTLKVTYLQQPEYPAHISSPTDHSILRLIPGAELQVNGTDLFSSEKIVVNAFYLAETPVTNQQYVDFLNSIIERVQVKDSDVFLDDRPVLKLSEKIRGYKPIIFENGRFAVKDPMHAACAVLMVTGFGAEAYAAFYGMRLPSSREWYFVMQSGGAKNVETRLPLPTPVINYEADKYGLRGINQLAEWGKNQKGQFVILGQAPSNMVEFDLIEHKNPSKYYTDTGFRVAKDPGQKD